MARFKANLTLEFNQKLADQEAAHEREMSALREEYESAPQPVSEPLPRFGFEAKLLGLAVGALILFDSYCVWEWLYRSCPD